MHLTSDADFSRLQAFTTNMIAFRAAATPGTGMAIELILAATAAGDDWQAVIPAQAEGAEVRWWATAATAAGGAAGAGAAAGASSVATDTAASDAISSSWGARLLSTESELFDPLHYNNGAVWPFMTGWWPLRCMTVSRK